MRFFDVFFYHMKSFRFFGRIGPARDATEEGDDVRESREGERTAVPGGNRQVVSRQLVSCGGENTKKGLREDIAPGRRPLTLHSADQIDWKKIVVSISLQNVIIT